jgi:hypothetical protein
MGRGCRLRSHIRTIRKSCVRRLRRGANVETMTLTHGAEYRALLLDTRRVELRYGGGKNHRRALRRAAVRSLRHRGDGTQPGPVRDDARRLDRGCRASSRSTAPALARRQGGGVGTPLRQTQQARTCMDLVVARQSRDPALEHQSRARCHELWSLRGGRHESRAGGRCEPDQGMRPERLRARARRQCKELNRRRLGHLRHWRA